MPGSRSRWWTHRDAGRLLARAGYTNGGPISVEELRYLRMSCWSLLNSPLPVSDCDRERVEVLHRDVTAALAIAAAERIESGA